MAKLNNKIYYLELITGVAFLSDALFILNFNLIL